MREDLLSRLLGLKILVPPLRDRIDDFWRVSSGGNETAPRLSNVAVPGLAAAAFAVLAGGPRLPRGPEADAALIAPPPEGQALRETGIPLPMNAGRLRRLRYHYRQPQAGSKRGSEGHFGLSHRLIAKTLDATFTLKDNYALVERMPIFPK